MVESGPARKLRLEIEAAAKKRQPFSKGDRVRIHPFRCETGAILAYGTIISVDRMGEDYYSVLQKSHLNHSLRSHHCGKGCLIVTTESGGELSSVKG